VSEDADGDDVGQARERRILDRDVMQDITADPALAQMADGMQ
jgi:hypothetical protein